MKESRFIELLNLYVDQQIPAEEAAALEEEILTNPRRRRTYQQYCKMHCACTMVFEASHAHAEQSASGGGRPAGAVIAFKPSSGRSVWRYYAAGLAAAACVAFVAVQAFLRPGKTAAHDSLVTVPTAGQPDPAEASAPWRLDPVIAPAGRPAASFVSQRLMGPIPTGVQGNAPFTLASFATVTVPTRGAADPLRPSVEQFVFDQTSSDPNSPPTFRSRPQAGGETEMTAFQFQR